MSSLRRRTGGSTYPGTSPAPRGSVRGVHFSPALATAFLVCAVACYGGASLLLSTGSHAVRSRVYITGIGLQAAAFLFAFAARVELPLLVVQSVSAASVAVTAVAGSAVRRWRLTLADGVALVAVVAGISLIGSASQPGRVAMPAAGSLLTPAVVAVLALIGLVVPTRPSLVGALAGLAYGSSAVAGRALAADPLAAVRTTTGVLAGAILVGGVLAGQILLTIAFRRGSAGALDRTPSTAVTGPVSAMYVAATLWPAAAGLLWLGDQLRPGRWPLAACGLALALTGTTRLTERQRRPDPIAVRP